MKKIILLFVLMFSAVFLRAENNKSINEDESSLLLLLSDDKGEHHITYVPLSDLKKCTFPTGPLRNNQISFNDFRKISQNTAQKINESIQQQEYLGLHLFCIDSESMGVKSKTCGFSIPGKGEMCYAFKFEYPLKETVAAILTNDQLEDLEIDIATSNCDTSIESPKEIQKSPSKLEKYFTELAVNIFINSLDFIENGKKTYDRLINYINNIRAKYVQPKT